MFLVPRRNMPYAVAATAWNADPAPVGTGRMLVCDEVNDKTFDALRGLPRRAPLAGPRADPVAQFRCKRGDLQDFLQAPQPALLPPCSGS